MNRLLAVLLLSVAGTASAFAQGATPAGNAVQGKETFLGVGCWECHGTVGQGGAGPALLPRLHPFQVLETFVRQGTAAGMPPYTRNVLTDAELTNIYAYLKSLPPPPDPDLLKAK